MFPGIIILLQFRQISHVSFCTYHNELLVTVICQEDYNYVIFGRMVKLAGILS